MKFLIISLFAFTSLFASADSGFNGNEVKLTKEEDYTLKQNLCNGLYDTAGVLGAGMYVLAGAVGAVFFSPEVVFEIASPEEYDAVTDDVIFLALDSANYALLSTVDMDPRCLDELKQKN